MTPLAWAMAALLLFLVGLSLSLGTAPLLLALWAAVLLAWVGAGVAVRRDARRLNFDDPEWAGVLPLLFGFGGLLYWFGYRRGRSDSSTDDIAQEL